MMLTRYYRRFSAARPGALVALIILSLAGSALRARADDGIFPPAPAAKACAPEASVIVEKYGDGLKLLGT